ncbi:hypothetical protein ETAR_26190 [Edwardsiella tarda]|uniref:hypothetical protein n=1 Tax=Edwardsiella tarda TaxID=636 RepID=UPI0030816DA4|nr:hypothetical protein GBS0709_23750 [Edwardsiella tarda]
MTDPSKMTEGVERILRWVFDKPVFLKPELGKKPAFLDESKDVSLRMTAFYNRAMDAIRNGKITAAECYDECLSVLATNLERIRFCTADHSEPDEAFLKNIEFFISVRNEFVNLVFLAARYNLGDDCFKRLHKFFESGTNYYYPQENVWTYNNLDFDNYKFLIHELYLYSVATLIKNERFEERLNLFDSYYVSRKIERGNNPLCLYVDIRQYVEIVQWRNDHRKLRRLSLHADLLKDRCHSVPISFDDINQTDFVCYLRSTIQATDYYSMWWPTTLLYARGHFPFEIFAKLKSKAYFSKIKGLLAIETADKFKQHIHELEKVIGCPSGNLIGFLH